MKSTKGLLLIIGFSLITMAAMKTNPTDTIKDNLFTAIRSIDYTSINILLSDGAEIDTVDRQGNTPLMIAAKIGNPRIVDIILSHSPEINKTNEQGVTALMIAAESGQLHIVEKLINKGADVSIRDGKGNTAVTLAGKFGHQQVVNFFRSIEA